MDGDIAPIAELCDVAGRRRAYYLDEVHAVSSMVPLALGLLIVTASSTDSTQGASDAQEDG